jgi:hypothetical protein
MIARALCWAFGHRRRRVIELSGALLYSPLCARCGELVTWMR